MPEARGDRPSLNWVLAGISPRAFEQAYRSLRQGGTLAFVALPADNSFRLPIFETVLNGTKIVSSIVGIRVDLAETFELHAAGKTRVIYEAWRLEGVNQAFEEVEQARARARLVFDISGAARTPAMATTARGGATVPAR